MKEKNSKVPRDTLEQSQLKPLGRAFRIKRNDLNLKIKDVEESSGVSSLTVSKLEKGLLLNCSLETLNKVATSLDLKLKLTIE
jgi:transcriptional regulator with XRE-family HTH domain